MRELISPRGPDATSYRGGFEGFLGSNSFIEPNRWKNDSCFDDFNKRSFSNLVTGINHSKIRSDFQDLYPYNSDSDVEEDEIDADEMWYEGAARSYNVISTQEHHKGKRMFKVLIKTNDSTSIFLGMSQLSLGIETISPLSKVQRYMWCVSDQSLLENDTPKSLPMGEAMDRLDDAWFRGNTKDGVIEFILAVDLDQCSLQFGCNGFMYDYSVSLARNQWYRVYVEYGKATQALMLLEVFNKPRTLQQLCPQHLLSMFQEEADDVLGTDEEDPFIRYLLDNYYYQYAGDKESEKDPKLTARAPLVEAYKLTVEKPVFA